MARFTERNTEGFSASDLETLNAAIDELAALGVDDDMDRVSDRLNNIWFEGATVEDLVTEAKRFFGVEA